jgi:hypothetical protein
MGLVPFIRTFNDFTIDDIDYAPFIAFLNTGLLTKSELQSLNKRENIKDLLQDIQASLEGKLAYLMQDFFTVQKDYKNFSDFWYSNKFSYSNLGTEFLELSGSEIITRYLNKDYSFNQIVINNFKKLLLINQNYNPNSVINLDFNKPFNYLYYHQKEADTLEYSGDNQQKMYFENIKLKKFEDFFVFNTIEKINLPIDTKDLNFISELYDIVDLYTPKNAFKLEIDLDKKDKKLLLLAAILVNIDKDKFEKIINNIIEEARLKGIYQNLKWSDYLICFVFSVSNLLNRQPLKDIKDKKFIEALIEICQEYEIHFEDCQLLANHYSKGDVSGDSKIIFDEIQKKIPTLIKEKI